MSSFSNSGRCGTELCSSFSFLLICLKSKHGQLLFFISFSFSFLRLKLENTVSCSNLRHVLCCRQIEEYTQLIASIKAQIKLVCIIHSVFFNSPTS